MLFFFFSHPCGYVSRSIHKHIDRGESRRWSVYACICILPYACVSSCCFYLDDTDPVRISKEKKKKKSTQINFLNIYFIDHFMRPLVCLYACVFAFDIS